LISGFWQAALLFLVYEFIYYWNHRMRHSVRLFWLEHSVHHNVSHINYMTGLQASWMSFFTGAWMIWSILYFIGFHPVDIAMMIWYGSFYRFLLHTELVPRLGWLEYVINTPSSHRVHHGINEIYKRKNYGSSLVIFDMIFGTYQTEMKNEVIVYGTRSMTKSLNPVTIVYNEWVRYYRELRSKFAKLSNNRS
jgi:sterol desaturase/sphingolipid hydroxylase (fatty acid hydroxylase superfamily)